MQQVYASMTLSVQDFVFETLEISSDFVDTQNNFVRLPWCFANRNVFRGFRFVIEPLAFRAEPCPPP